MSVVVVWLAAHNCHGAVDLLGEEEAYHFVGERHARERNFAVGAVIESAGKSVRPSYDENKAFYSLQSRAAYEIRKFA